MAITKNEGTLKWKGICYQYSLEISDASHAQFIEGTKIKKIVVVDLVTKMKVIHFDSKWRQWPSNKYFELWNMITRPYVISPPIEVLIEVSVEDIELESNSKNSS